MVLRQTIKEIGLHEAAHAVCAAALGCPVRYVCIQYVHDVLIGMTENLPRPGMRRSDKIAILFAGLLSREYTYLHFNVPPITAFIRPSSISPLKPGRRLASAIQRHHFDKTDNVDDLLPGGDWGQIQELLAGCRNPDRISRRGEDLARKTLAKNERALFQVAERLLGCGILTGRTLQSLLRDVVPVG